MMTSSLRAALGLGLLIALFAAFSSAPGLQAEDEKAAKAKLGEKAKAATPETEEAKINPVKVDISTTGVFDSAGHAEVMLEPEEWSSFKVESATDHGTMVREGEPIIQFQVDKIDEKLESMALSFELATLSLKLAEESVKTLTLTTPMDLKEAEESALYAEDDYNYFKKVTEPMSVKTEEFQLKSSIQRLEAAEEELNQLQKMYDADDLTEETEEIVLKRAKQSVEVARFYNEMARLSHDRTLETTLPRRSKREALNLERAKLRLERTRISLPVNLNEKKISLAKQKIEYEKLEKQIADLKKDRDLFEITAPKQGLLFYGQVVNGKLSTASTYKKLLVENGTIPARKVFMTIVDTENLFVRISVKEDQLSTIKVGQSVKITPTAYPDTKMAGEVKSVTRIPNASGSYSAEISIPKSEFEGLESGQIVPTMTCKIKIQAYLNKDAVTVPSTVVFRDELDEDERFVYLAPASKDEKPKKQVVKVGKTSGKLLEILEGLEAGQKVLKKKPEEK